MSNIQVFNNEEFGKVRTIVINGIPHFVGKDVAESLGYKNTRDAISRHVDSEDKAEVEFHDGSQNRKAIGINESGLYSLILSSELPNAKKFKRWVIGEVLPSIRKTLNALELVTYTPSDLSLVQMRDGFCYTTTNKIAEIFNREHKNILSIIDKLLENNDINEEDVLKSKPMSVSDFIRQHIKETTYLDNYNREQRSYELDEYAFSMVALSLTGRKAERFKVSFINQFFYMRQVLLDRTKTLAIEQVLPQKKSLRQYVYLIKNEGTKNIKIGVGQNPEQRLKQLQTGADADLTLIYKSMVCSNAYEIETYMHNEFAEYNVRNEWFNCDEDMLINELERCEYVLESDFNIGGKEITGFQ